MRAFIRSVFIVAIISTTISCETKSAQIPNLQQNEVSQTKTSINEHAMTSQFSEQERHITVQLPTGYFERPDQRFPVLYILDGENNLEFTNIVAKFMSDDGQIPELIIVGLHAGETRGADYSPEFVTENAPAGTVPGEATQFLKYIDMELLPFIDQTYRTTSYHMLSGHSLGGLFSTFALIEKPTLFQGYFAQSPFFNARISASFVERMTTLMKENPDLQSSYFITLGDEPNLEAGFVKMTSALKDNAPVAFQWNAERQDGRSHMQTRLIGIYRALEQNFGQDWPLAQAAKSGNIKAHIDGLSKKYGTEARYNHEGFFGEIQRLLQSGDVASGIAMAKVYVDQYPDSPFPYFLLANAYASGGNRVAALEQVDIAVNLIESNPEPSADMKQIYMRLKQMRTALSAK